MTAPSRTHLPDARVQPRFAGLTTFCRFPRASDVAAASRPCDWLLYGVPFDGGVTFRPGARFGPRAIREASQYIKPFHSELGVNIAQVLSCADAGDSPVAPFDCETNALTVRDFALNLPEPAHSKLLAVGGDHSIAYANLAATHARRAALGANHAGLAVLHIDAHLDTVDAVWSERWSHASPFRRALESGLIDPSAMLSVGLRGTMNDPADFDFAGSRGVTLVPMTRWHAEGVRVVREFIQRLNGRELYITFDVDGVDPAFTPGTGTPVVGGLSAVEALSLLRLFKGVPLAGADIVEILPDRDPSGITAMFAAQLLAEFLAIDATARAG